MSKPKTYVVEPGPFTPEQPRSFLGGLDEALVALLGKWLAGAPEGVRQLRRAEVVFRGEPKFVAEFLDHAADHGGAPVLVVMRAMSADWSDAVRNGLGIAQSVAQYGLDPLAFPRPSLALWLAWQDEVRPR